MIPVLSVADSAAARLPMVGVPGFQAISDDMVAFGDQQIRLCPPDAAPTPMPARDGRGWIGLLP